MCGVVFGLDCARHARTVSPYLTWTLPIPPDTIESSSNRHRMKRNQEYTSPSPTTSGNATVVTGSSSSPSSETLHPVIQITDIHIDPYYESGTNADCGEPLCCRRESSGRPVNPSKAAGSWGDYRNCDTPLTSLKSALEHITLTHPDVSLAFS